MVDTVRATSLRCGYGGGRAAHRTRRGLASTRGGARRYRRLPRLRDRGPGRGGQEPTGARVGAQSDVRRFLGAVGGGDGIGTDGSAGGIGRMVRPSHLQPPSVDRPARAVVRFRRFGRGAVGRRCASARRTFGIRDPPCGSAWDRQADRHGAVRRAGTRCRDRAVEGRHASPARPSALVAIRVRRTACQCARQSRRREIGVTSVEPDAGQRLVPAASRITGGDQRPTSRLSRIMVLAGGIHRFRQYCGPARRTDPSPPGGGAHGPRHGRGRGTAARRGAVGAVRPRGGGRGGEPRADPGGRRRSAENCANGSSAVRRGASSTSRGHAPAAPAGACRVGARGSPAVRTRGRRTAGSPAHRLGPADRPGPVPERRSGCDGAAGSVALRAAGACEFARRRRGRSRPLSCSRPPAAEPGNRGRGCARRHDAGKPDGRSARASSDAPGYEHAVDPCAVGGVETDRRRRARRRPADRGGVVARRSNRTERCRG